MQKLNGVACEHATSLRRHGSDGTFTHIHSVSQVVTDSNNLKAPTDGVETHGSDPRTDLGHWEARWSGRLRADIVCSQSSGALGRRDAWTYSRTKDAPDSGAAGAAGPRQTHYRR